MACSSAGAAVDYEGRNIISVELAPQPGGQAPLPAGLPLKVGQPYSAANVRAAIERLFITGRFSDVAIDASLHDGGVAIRILTSANLFIGRVSVSGVSHAPNTGQLENATKMDLGTVFEEEKVKTAVANIEAVLRENGFYLATVTPELEHIPEFAEVNVTFRVVPGPRARYAPPVITGHPKKDPQKLINAARWKRWLFFPGFKPVTQARTQNGLERMRGLYRKDRRLMARVTLENLAYQPKSNSLTATVDAEAGPKVDLNVEGVKISRGRLRELVPVYQEQSVDNDLLFEGGRNIAGYLQSLGYFDAQADYHREPKDQASVRRAEQLRITYQVDRGERFKLMAVNIEGNRYFDTRTIRERMFLLPAGFLSYRHGRFSEQYLERDKEAIENLYRANGFRDVKVLSSVEPGYAGKPDRVAVTIRIEEGPQWFVGNLNLVGVSPAYYQDVAAMLRSTEGQPYSDLNMAADQDNVLNYYYDRGFPAARFEAGVENAAGAHRVNIRYSVTEGPRQFVRRVIVGGLRSTDRDLVSDRISLAPGDPLSRSAMVDSQRRLYDLGIFAKVSTAIQNPDGIESNKYVLYELEEARRWAFNFGFGAEIARIGGGGTTDLTQPAGGTGFSPRGSFGITRYNLFGIGHSLGLQTQISTILKRSILTYQAPQFEGSDNFNLSFSALFDDSKNVRTFSARREEGSVQLGQRLSRANSLQYRLTYRRVSVDKNTLNITPQLIPLLSQPVRIGLVSSTFIQDRRDDPIDTTHGIYNTLDVGLATKTLASQSSFLRLMGKNSTYYRVGDAVIARSLTFGWINNFTNREIPLPERFFSGGGSSHRGFADNQAGPRDPVTGFPLGGNAVLLHQFEYRFPLAGDSTRGVLFHDMGDVFSDIKSMSMRVRQKNLTDFDYMVHAVGFGIRYKTPIGPVRIDLAYSINPPAFVGFKGTRDQLLFCGGPNPPSGVECAGVFNVRQQLSHFQFHFSLGQTF